MACFSGAGKGEDGGAQRANSAASDGAGWSKGDTIVVIQDKCASDIKVAADYDSIGSIVANGGCTGCEIEGGVRICVPLGKAGDIAASVRGTGREVNASATQCASGAGDLAGESDPRGGRSSDSARFSKLLLMVPNPESVVLLARRRPLAALMVPPAIVVLPRTATSGSMQVSV